jgi:hypothetical protein
VTVRDAFGNPVNGAAVTLAAAPVSGNKLTQPVGTTDVNGQITGTLASTKAEVKTVSATVNRTVPVGQTVPVTVGPATATQLTFTTQPSTAVLTSNIAPPVVVTALDEFANVATGFTDAVTMAIGNDGSLLKNATLGGTTTVAPVSGSASFENLTINGLNATGVGYTLLASTTGMTVESAPFAIVALLP